MNFKSIRDQAKIIRDHLTLKPVEECFIAFIRNTTFDNPQCKKLNILVQASQDYYYLVIFSSILRSLKKNYSVKISWIMMAFAYRKHGKSMMLKTTSAYERKWTKIYQSFGGKTVFTHLYWWFTLDRGATQDAELSFQNLKSKMQLVQTEYCGIKIGDLIYDTYLRFKPAATVNLTDDFLKLLLVHAFTTAKKAKVLFEKNKYDFLLTSYTSYIHHGIVARAALLSGTRVFSTGGHSQLSKEVTLPFPNHNKDFPVYKEQFAALSPDEQAKGKLLAKQQLEARFTGKIDLSTSYMKRSAYEANGGTEFLFESSPKKRVVIFLHCFFDSPHIYRKMIYADFYEWLKATLTILNTAENQAKYDVYVKPHPNGFDGNEEIIEEITRHFPFIHVIPKETNNLQLIKQGFDLAITVYGTLGHEFPYFGIPVLNAGDNPHINYSFSTHAETEEQYQNYLNNIDLVKKPTEQSREEILEFYFMHSLYMIAGKLPPEENKIIVDLIVSTVIEGKLQKYIDDCERDPEYLKKTDELIFKSFSAVLNQ
jgi:hypothetical protein